MNKEIEFVIAHEILHCVFDHFTRREDRDPRLYNIACDYIVNNLLIRDRIGSNPKIVDCYHDTNFKMIAKTFFGFEELLEKELKQLGAQEVEKGNRMVSFIGDKGFMYKANLCLRTALKVLKPKDELKKT